MYSIKQQGETVQTYVIEAVADTRADIASLPTTWAVGSTCLVIEDSSAKQCSTFKLTSKRMIQLSNIRSSSIAYFNIW